MLCVERSLRRCHDDWDIALDALVGFARQRLQFYVPIIIMYYIKI